MARLILHLSLGVTLFFLQILLLPLHQTRLELLNLLVFYEAIHPFLFSAVFLAVLLGLVVDCYANGPLGLYTGLYLLVVILARVFKRHLNLQAIIPQILAVALTLVIQGGLELGILSLLEPSGVFHFQAVRLNLEKAGVTALLAPPSFLLLYWLDKTAGRYFFDPHSASTELDDLD
ncbi:MAG: hypothetical protein BZ151_07645 [Desulfobacca sp. 4484_104]|nr:MAG: hypothetical protein BZ151_07645 [Desulfobacca sp. 4484_104]RLA88833.1 MAG: hypothetical protein DRG58_06870 [Deltaproteobacteria bacterium]